MVVSVLVLLVLVLLLPAGHSYRQQRLLCSHTQTSPSLWSSAHSRQCLSSKSSLHAIRNPFRKYPDQPTNGLPQHVVESLQNNAVLRLLSSAYSFFYWLPRNNMLYDTPWSFLRNSTSQFLAWYQLPHNLPPYSYLGAADLPADFFCFGLPGNTLPLGNWDPMGFAQVNQRVVLKYRESELKHGRIAMLAFVGCFVQELWHPLHSEVGGLSVTHMEQLKTLHTSSLFPYNQQLEYWLIIFTMMLIESWGYVKYWKLWRADEYNHQFDHNIGLGNIAEVRH